MNEMKFPTSSILRTQAVVYQEKQFCGCDRVVCVHNYVTHNVYRTFKIHIRIDFRPFLWSTQWVSGQIQQNNSKWFKTKFLSFLLNRAAPVKIQ